MKRGQAISLDLIAGGVLFLVFVAVFIALMLNLTARDSGEQLEYELLYTFENLENSLRDPALASQAFYSAYRVDATTLTAFASAQGSVDAFFLEDSGPANGLGLSEEGYDVCMYFIDNDQSFLNMQGKVALGEVPLNPQSESCSVNVLAGRSPCDGYERAMSTFRPVLYDTGTYQENRIIQMNVVACKL